jgi:hypothetical protein
MKLALSSIAGLAISLLPVIIVPIAGFLADWPGVLVVFVLAGAIPAYWLGRRKAPARSKKQVVTMCGSSGILPLLLGAISLKVHPDDPLGTAYILLAVVTMGSCVLGWLVSFRAEPRNQAQATDVASHQ